MLYISDRGLSVISLLIMHTAIRKLWMDRHTFTQTAGVQCSLNTPLCRQAAGIVYQRWFDVGTRLSYYPLLPRSPMGVLTHSVALSSLLITASVEKMFHGKCAKGLCVFLYVCVCVCVLYAHLNSTFWQKAWAKFFFLSFVLSFFLWKMHGANFKGSHILGNFSSFKSMWLLVSELCKLHLCVFVKEPITLEGAWGCDGSFWGTQSLCSLWHFKARCVSPPFKPLGMTHLWQCYIIRHALKAPATLPWKTAHSWLILLSQLQPKHISD